MSAHLIGSLIVLSFDFSGRLDPDSAPCAVGFVSELALWMRRGWPRQSGLVQRRDSFAGGGDIMSCGDSLVSHA